MNPLEETINELLQKVENGLRKNHINTTVPHVALDYQSLLTAYLSTSFGLIERLDMLEAQYFVNNRKDNKSDNATKRAWEITDEGIRQKFWQTRIKRINVLIDGLEKIYYQGRRDYEQKQLK